MRIGIDISPLCRSRTGVAMYGYYLVRYLTEIDRLNTYFLYINKPISLDFPLPSNFFIRPQQMPLPQFQAWFHLGLPVTFRRDRLDIFHSINFLIPPVPGCKTVSTVHDLSSLVIPGQHRLLHRLSHSLFLKSSLRRADRLIAVSQSTKDEIDRILPNCSNKTDVILEAAAPEFRPIENENFLKSIRQSYELPERFLLYVGTLEPRKNIEGLLLAYARVKDKIPHKLVVVGGRGWKYTPIFDVVKSNGMEEHVIFTGYITQKDLPALYNLADFFVYPSFYEGFGLPVMEAMSSRTAVITSNCSSLAEIAGDAALLVNPRDEDQIADAIVKLARDANLREDFARKGLTRSRSFSWTLTADRTLSLYRETVET